ncbi:hypothetical protein D3C79_897990 [compost metagenome]
MIAHLAELLFEVVCGEQFRRATRHTTGEIGGDMANLVGGEFTHRGFFHCRDSGRNAENAAERRHQQARLQVNAGKHTEKSFFDIGDTDDFFAVSSMRRHAALHNFFGS